MMVKGSITGLCGGGTQWNKGEGTDIWVVEKGKVSITPLQGELSIAPGNPFVKGLPSLLVRERKIRFDTYGARKYNLRGRQEGKYTSPHSSGSLFPSRVELSWQRRF
ncbi:MAG TPA: hypothetical protein VJ441_01770 [Dehalococcoidia bacterium]|nr:hypothetical protein [Dehalococcoidia bacterium]